MTPDRRRAIGVLAASAAAAAAGVWMVPREGIVADGRSFDLQAMVPRSFGAWRIDPNVIPVLPNADLQKVIEESYDQTLARTYIDDRGYPVMLSIAYGGRRNQGMDIHRPEICYPAQGLALRSPTTEAVIALRDRSLPVKRLVAGVGTRHEPITYWLVVGNDLASFGYGHRLALLKYGLTGRVPDGMLVRTSSVDRNEARSYAAQADFIVDLVAALDGEGRRRLLGAQVVDAAS